MDFVRLLWEAKSLANPGIQDGNRIVNNDLTSILTAVQSVRNNMNPTGGPPKDAAKVKTAIMELLFRSASLAGNEQIETEEFEEFLKSKERP